jgi:tetratricopeptide (TPR) repeat protein
MTRRRPPPPLIAVTLLAALAAGCGDGATTSDQAPAPTADRAAAATYVGREQCRACHAETYQAWLGSDHDKAMDVADDSTVLGDFSGVEFSSHGVTSRFFRRDGRFFVHTRGPDGAMADFELTHTFGHDPLQQYLAPFPGGRLQCLTIAWDADEQRWFDLYPDRDIPPTDWLHWTGPGQNWNGMCAECHSTDLRKNYDPDTRTFDTTWFEIDVSCEACHGPGSDHVQWARHRPGTGNDPTMGLTVATGGMAGADLVNLCAPCHSRRVILGDYEQAGEPLMEHHLPVTLGEDQYFADGQILDEVYVWGSFVQSRMYHRGVSCRDCHDSHSLQLRHEGNALCLRCHEPEKYDRLAHHHHEALTAAGAPNPGTLCVKCHMPERAYMVIDERADHSLRVPRPDLTVSLGTPNACSTADCHGDQPAAWAAAHTARWYGPPEGLHYGELIAAGRRRDPRVLGELTAATADTVLPVIVRATVVALLAAYPPDATMATYDRALADPEPLIRHTAASQAPVMAPERFVERLSPLLDDPVRAVRLAAGSRLAGVPDGILTPARRRQLADVLADYEQAMTYSLDFTFGGLNLGNLYSRLGDPDQAERGYRAALDVDPVFVPALSNLAVLLSGQGRNAEAEALLRRALLAEPDLPELTYSLGLLLAEMGRYREAETYLARAVAAMPDHPRAARNLEQVRAYLRSR